eukprot:jgi/Tetstr1/459980/TSEL_005304.t1
MPHQEGRWHRVPRDINMQKLQFTGAGTIMPQVGWTSYKCPDCDLPLCIIPSKRRKGVACWTRHRRMTAQELEVYGVNRRTD